MGTGSLTHGPRPTCVPLLPSLCRSPAGLGSVPHPTPPPTYIHTHSHPHAFTHISHPPRGIPDSTGPQSRMGGGTDARAQGNPRLCQGQGDVPHPLCLTPGHLPLPALVFQASVWCMAVCWEVGRGVGQLEQTSGAFLPMSVHPPNPFFCPFL